MLKRRGLSVLIMLVMLVTSINGFSVPVKAANAYYMATNGNDANSGSISAPFATIAKFLDVAQPGDTLYIREGIYYGQETTIKKSGTSGNPISIRNYPNEVPVLDGQREQRTGSANVAHMAFWSHDNPKISWITIQGLYIRNYKRSGMSLGENYTDQSEALHDVVIKYNVVDNCGQNGIKVCFSNNVLVENNLISRTGYDPDWGSWSSGINFFKLTGTNNIARGNISFHHVDVSSHHTDGNGMILDLSHKDENGVANPTSGGATAENNVFFENGGAGLAWTCSYNGTIRNNTMVNNAKESTYTHPGVGMIFWDANKNMKVTNNIIYQSSGSNAWSENLAFENSVISNNNVSGKSGYTDPRFTDASANDFSLQSNSASIDAGTSSYASTTGLLYDKRIIKSEAPGPLHPSWYHLAPDLEFIRSVNGLENCFGSVSRPQLNGIDIGAAEYSTTGKVWSTPSTKSPLPESSNLVLNPGFEVATHPYWVWSANAYSVYSVSSTDKHTGTNSIKQTGTQSWETLSQIISVKPNTDYVLSGWFKGNSNVGLRAFRKDWSELNTNWVVPTSTWTKQSVSFNSGSSTEIVVVLQDASEGTTYIDDLELTAANQATPTPTPTATPTPTPTATPTPGGTTRYEAEDGTLNGCQVWYESSASAGAEVAYFDGTGDSVQITVNASKAGTYNLYIGYGCDANSQVSIYVNGTHKADKLLPSTGAWNNYQKSTAVSLSLNAGNNTVKLQLDSSDYGYPELDYIDLQ